MAPAYSPSQYRLTRKWKFLKDTQETINSAYLHRAGLEISVLKETSILYLCLSLLLEFLKSYTYILFIIKEQS